MLPMTTSQQEETIYSPFSSLTHYGSDSAPGGGSQLTTTGLTNSEMFAASFPVDPLEHPICSQYTNYDWSGSGAEPYGAVSAAFQPPTKLDRPEGEGWFQREAPLANLQPPSTDGMVVFPGTFTFETTSNDLFGQRAGSLPRLITDSISSDSSGSLPPSSIIAASPWPSDAWSTSDPKLLGHQYTTIDPRCILDGLVSSYSNPYAEQPPSRPLGATLPQVSGLETAPLTAADGQTSVPIPIPIYTSEEEELDAIRAQIRRAPFMTSSPQSPEPTVGSLEDHYTRGRGIPGKSIFTAFIQVLGSGEYQCIHCNATYNKLERAIGDQARHFEFKPYICYMKHDGKKVCGKAFGMKDYRKTHQERENKPIVHCDICSAPIKHERNMERHLRQVHSQTPPTTPSRKAQARRAAKKRLKIEQKAEGETIKRK